MIPTIEIDDSRVSLRLEKIGPNVHQRLVETLRPLEQQIVSDARDRATAHIRFEGKKAPGSYLAAIHGGVSDKGKDGVVAYVRSSHPLAHLLEYGATLPARSFGPDAAAVLAFLEDGATVFARHVSLPSVKIPSYPAIHPAFDAKKAEIEQTIKRAVIGAAGER